MQQRWIGSASAKPANGCGAGCTSSSRASAAAHLHIVPMLHDAGLAAVTRGRRQARARPATSALGAHLSGGIGALLLTAWRGGSHT